MDSFIAQVIEASLPILTGRGKKRGGRQGENWEENVLLGLLVRPERGQPKNQNKMVYNIYAIYSYLKSTEIIQNIEHVPLIN